MSAAPRSSWILAMSLAMLPFAVPRPGTLLAPASPEASTARHAAPMPPHSTDDSLTLLLFATAPPREVVVTGSSRASAGRSLTLRAAGRGVLIAGDDAVPRFELAAPRPVTLRAGERIRRVRGKITIVEADGALRVTARIAARDYLAATLAAEASRRDPIEYLTALAVLQRNYLATHRGRHGAVADLCDNTHCQVAELTSAADGFDRVVTRARGLELTAGAGRPCYYSAVCGGGTMTPGDIWRAPEPGYSRVECRGCRASHWYRWTRTVPATPATARLLQPPAPTPFVDDDFKIRVGRALGFNVLPSNTIEKIERRGQRYVIAGRGFGHRIGLCQAGARALALQGWSAEQILRQYFPTAALTRRPSVTNR